MRPYQVQVVAEYRDEARDSEIVLVDIPDEVAQVDTFAAFTYAAEATDDLFIGASSLSITKVSRHGESLWTSLYAE